MHDQERAPLTPSGQDYRLPKSVTPRRYEIKLTPDLKQFTFSGEESVAIKVEQGTNEIVLHALELEILTVEAERGAVLSGQVRPRPVCLRSVFPREAHDPLRVLRPIDNRAPDQPHVGDLVEQPLPPVHVLPAVARRPLPVQTLHELARLVLVVIRQAERDPFTFRPSSNCDTLDESKRSCLPTLPFD